MSLLKASFWLTVSELVFNLSGYIIHSILGRYLGPAEYGRYGIVITFATMIVVLIGSGVPVAMSKYLSEVRKKDAGTILSIRKTGAIVQTILILVVTIIYYFLVPPIAGILLNDSSLVPLFKFSTPIIPAFALASFYVSYFNGIHKFNQQSVIKLYRGIAKVIFIVALGYLFSTKGAIIGHSIAPFSVFLLAYILDPFKGGKASEKSYISWQKMLAFAWPITLFMLFYEIMISIDLYMVKGLLQSDSVTGIYNAALTIGRLPFYAFYFLTIILLPKISETTSQNNITETKRILSVAIKFLLMLLFPAITLLSFFSTSISLFFFGDDYIAAGAPLAILAFGFGFLVIFYVLAFVLNGAGKNKAPMWIAFGGVLLNSFLNYFLINKYGIVGAAISTSLASFVVMLAAVIFTQKKLVPFLEPVSIVKYLLGSGLIYAIASAFLVQGKFVFILWSILLFIIYFAFLLLTKEISKKDLLFLRESLKNTKKSA
jgi:stage V sporulation protein B